MTDRCAPFPWLPNAVAIAARSGIQAGIADEHELMLHVMRWVYPRRPDTGAAITWPPGDADAPALRCIWDRTHIEVSYLLAAYYREAANLITKE